MKHILNETYGFVRRTTGYNPGTKKGFFTTLADPNAFRMYAKNLAEGLTESDRRVFLSLAKNARRNILESVSSSSGNISNYETLVIPILRNFMPKLISKELVNVMPIDKPDVIRPFLKPRFRKPTLTPGGDPSYTDYDYEFPVTSTDISRGPQFGGMNGSTTTVSGYSAVPQAIASGLDILALHGLTAAEAHVEKDFVITGVSADAGETFWTTGINIRCTVDGNFTAPVVYDEYGNYDVLTGYVDFKNGKLFVHANGSGINAIQYVAHVSLEENQINPTVEMNIEKISLRVVDRRISGIWTTNLETDAKTLYDVSVQAELANAMGEQIALDIDREIITDLINLVDNRNTLHTITFPVNQPTTYVQGPKEWMGQIVTATNMLAAKIYNDTRMGSANTLACNPMDAAIFESLNGFEYLGDSVAGGDVGYRSATVAHGKYKLLVSSLVPEGKVLVKYRSDDETRAAYIFAPYVPAQMVPYPLGANPSMSIISRYATQTIREKAVGYINIDRTTPAESAWTPTLA